MSLDPTGAFDVADLDVEPPESGTSVLLTGDDADALESVYYRLVAAPPGERSILLTTDASATEAKRSLRTARDGADDRVTILAGSGPTTARDVTAVDDVGDLTGLGMEFSSLVAESRQEAERHRAGIFLCSSICQAVDDTRSVYRFLNANFLTPLRRAEMIGVCALDTSADIGADMNSTISGLETSFKARVHVEADGPRTATLDVSGRDVPADSVEVRL